MSKAFKARKKTSPVWNYFTPIDSQYSRCNECKKIVSYKTSTSNLKKHLASKHPNITLATEEFFYDFSERKEFEPEGEEYDIAETTPEVIELEDGVMHIRPTPNKLIMPKKTLLTQTLVKNSSLPSQNRIKPSNSNDKSQIIQEAINMLSTASQVDSAPENDDDEFSQFGKYLMSQLRQLPLVSALQLQEKFQSLLTRERINIMLKSNESYNLKPCIQNQCSQHHQSTQHNQCTRHHQSTHHNQCTPVESLCSCQRQFVQQKQDTQHCSTKCKNTQTNENNHSIGNIEISCVTSQADTEVDEQKDISSSKEASDL